MNGQPDAEALIHAISRSLSHAEVLARRRPPLHREAVLEALERAQEAPAAALTATTRAGTGERRQGAGGRL